MTRERLYGDEMGLTDVIEIYSKGEYPSSALSNFAEHHFTLDGVCCGSMEGFLQSLKYREPAKQAQICALIGKEANRAGEKKHLWKLVKTVWWKGRAYGLLSDELQRLIDRAYDEMYEQSSSFRQALAETGERTLAHTVGKKDMRTTILTEYQFVRRLEALRERTRDAGPAAPVRDGPGPAAVPFKHQWTGKMIPRATGPGERCEHSGSGYISCRSFRLEWVSRRTDGSGRPLRARTPEPHTEIMPKNAFTAAGKTYGAPRQLVCTWESERSSWARDIYGRAVLMAAEPFPCFDSSDYLCEDRYFRWFLLCEDGKFTCVYHTDGTDTVTVTEDVLDMEEPCWKQIGLEKCFEEDAHA